LIILSIASLNTRWTTTVVNY